MENSKPHTFIGLFRESEGEQFLPLNKIEIPIIQRDYAQGRNDKKTKRIRERFVSSLHDALVQCKPIKLDFIYGDIKDRKLIPLDGQQRLTTLFLLHWYIARHEDIEESTFAFLKNFSYWTRDSARDFCNSLIDYTPDFSVEKLSEEIKDQSWMPLDWRYDPTISSMLNMLDDIHLAFKDTCNLWEQLEKKCISFHFLPIEELGLTDELYIKMNSRGKPLTEFEHFKAIWEGYIREIDPSYATEIGRKVDLDWTDFLWPYRGDNQIIDDEFTKYFCYLCAIIFYKKYPDEKRPELLDILKVSKILFHDKSSEDVEENLKFIEESFDCLCQSKESITSLFGNFLTNEDHVSDKSSITESTDVFNDCCSNFGEMRSAHVRSFSIGRMILLYSFLLFFKNRDTISNEAFARRLRIVNNLIKASEFELRDVHMKALLEQTDEIILNGEINVAEGRLSFNALQLQEEYEKDIWLKSHEDKQELLFTLEDHPLLNGTIRVIGLDSIELTNRFYSLFECDKGLVNRALLSIGDYSQKIAWRYQIGSARNDTSWRALFRVNKDNIVNVHNILIQLLNKQENFTNDYLQSLIDQYIATTTTFDWRYYIVKYDSMRPEKYGMYYWYGHKEREKKSYRILMMMTEKSIGGRNFNIFLKTLYDRAGGIDAVLGQYAYAGDGDKLIFENRNKYIVCEDNCYRICDRQTNEELDTIDIPQEDGIDIVDRIEIGMKIIEEIRNNHQ